MAVCSARSVELMEKFVQSIPSHNKGRVIDVAGGDGRFSVDFLLKEYKKVDLFDKCKIGCEKAKVAMKSHPNCGIIEKSEM